MGEGHCRLRTEGPNQSAAERRAPVYRVLNHWPLEDARSGFSGTSGDQSRVWRLGNCPYEPRAIFLRAGGNDLWAGKSSEEVFADFKEFVAKVHSKLPSTEIIFISLSPSIQRWKQADKEKALNSMVEQYCKQTPRLKYIDTYSLPLGPDGKPRPELFVEDKLHFNAEGYKLLVERVRPYLPGEVP